MSRAPSLRAQLAGAMLREGRTVELPATGSSMRPLIPPGGVVQVEPARATDVRPGDVVVVDDGERLVCHRLLYVAGGRAVTRGDDSLECDRPVPLAAIVGRVALQSSPHALYCAVRALFR
jgi:phage repressor protein C with HTH and peptisase S24 domain